MMVCSGSLISCDLVLTAAHCLKYRNAPGNRFWIYLQHAGILKMSNTKIELFCDSQACEGLHDLVFDLGILRLDSPAWDIRLNEPSKRSYMESRKKANFVGFGVRTARISNYNLKRQTSIHLSRCNTSVSNDHSFCSNLSDSSSAPCHKDSGGPLYTVSGSGSYSLLGIATKTGRGCRDGQAVYNDATSPPIHLWLKERIYESKQRCIKSARYPSEIMSEPRGWLDEASQYQELDIKVTHGLNELLVTMNHAPGARSDEMYNDFDLKLVGPEADSASLLPYCDNTWKLLSVCRVPSPSEGTWKARVTRKHGEGHFQLVATGITN